MNELLQKLLEAEVLTAETKKDLETAFSTTINEAVEAAKKDAAADVRAELTEQWIQERDALIEAVDAKVDEFLKAEIEELRESIEAFRDLEAEYAEKLVEAKEQMADEVKGDLEELVEKLDAFLEIRLSAEIEELRESIEEVKKDEFGRKVFAAFAEEYKLNYAEDGQFASSLRETEERLHDTTTALEETLAELSAMKREQKMSKVLSPLSGRAKEVMEAILKSVPTEQLDEGYQTFIGRVVKETTKKEPTEKENKVLAEGDSKKAITENDGVVVTGDDKETLTENNKESTEEAQAKAARKAELRKLMGF